MSVPPNLPMPPMPPAPKKKHTGRTIILALLACLVLFGGCGALLSGGGSDDNASSPSSTSATDEPSDQATTPVDDATDEATSEPTHTTKKAAHKVVHVTPKVVFQVWGSASAGVDVTYGSDSDNRQGPSRPGFTRKLKLHEDALYYYVTAQLQGGGNIHCSVTVDGVTKKGHASGSYNICSAQVDSGLLGWG
jgi:hypothetical protein